MPIGSSWNVSASTVTGTAGVDYGFIFFALALVVAAIVLILVITSLERYTKFFKVLNWLGKSIKYAIYGTGISAAGAGLYVVCSVIATTGSGIDPMIFVWIIGGYVALTMLGYIGEKTFNRIKSMHAQYKEKVKA